jgi:hypothetical protein
VAGRPKFATTAVPTYAHAGPVVGFLGVLMRWNALVAVALTTLPCAVATAAEKVPDALLAGVSFGINSSSLTRDAGGLEIESDANDTTGIAYGFKIGMRLRRDLDLYLVHDAALVNRGDNYGVSILGVGATYDTRRGGLIPKAIVALGKGYQANNSRDDAKTPEGWALIVGGEWPLHRDLAVNAFYKRVEVDQFAGEVRTETLKYDILQVMLTYELL